MDETEECLDTFMRKPLKTVVANYFILCGACLLGCLFLLHFSMRSAERLSDESLFWNTGWTVTVHNERYENVDISTFLFSVTNTGDQVIMENTLPETDVENPILRVYEWYSTIDVFLGKKQVYSWGHDLFDAHKSTGCGWHFIETGAYPAGTPVKIVLTVTEPRSFSSLKPVYFGDASRSYSSYFISKMFILACSLFFVMLGLCGAIISVVLAFLKKNWRNLLIIASCSFWLGVVVMHNNGCMVLLTSNFPLVTWMEHFSIYCLDLSLFALLYFSMTTEPWQRRLVGGGTILFGLYVVVVLILHALNVCHLPATRLIMYLLIGIQVAIALIVVISNFIKTSSSLVVPSLGLLSMVFAVVVDIARYAIVKYTAFQSEYTKGTLLAFGALIFLISMGVNYISEVHVYAEMKADDDMKARLDSMTAAFDAAVKIAAPKEAMLLEDFEESKERT